jgi:molybdopterin converting factor small subunit
MRILFFAHLQDAGGGAEMHLPGDDVDADGLWQLLIAARPALAPFRASVRLAKNSAYAAPDTRFYETDEVALIPPVSGG